MSTAQAFLGNKTPLESFAESIAGSWHLIAICLGIATFAAILWLFFIPFISTLMVWITIWFTFIASVVATAYTWGYYYETVMDVDLSFVYKIDFFFLNEEILLCLALSSSILLVFMIFFLYYSYKRMDLSIQIIDESSNLLKDVQLVFIVPIINYVFITALFFFSLIVISLLFFCEEQVLHNIATTISLYVTPIEIPSHRYF